MATTDKDKPIAVNDEPVVAASVEIRKRPAYAATTMTFGDGTPFVGLTATVSPDEAERLIALGTCEKV